MPTRSAASNAGSLRANVCKTESTRHRHIMSAHPRQRELDTSWYNPNSKITSSLRMTSSATHSKVGEGTSVTMYRPQAAIAQIALQSMEHADDVGAHDALVVPK